MTAADAARVAGQIAAGEVIAEPDTWTTMPARDMSGALIGQTVTVSPRFTGVARATGQVWAIRHQDSAVIVELRDETTGRLDHHSLDRRDLVVVHGGIG